MLHRRFINDQLAHKKAPFVYLWDGLDGWETLRTYAFAAYHITLFYHRLEEIAMKKVHPAAQRPVSVAFRGRLV